MIFLAAFFMTLIEKRSFADYYLPPREAFGKRFWQGVPYGFAMVSLLIAVIAAFHGFSIEGVALDGGAIVKYGLLYAVGFFLVAFFEEFSFRGYMQSTLGSGIGFWPAAIILSILFGAIHLGNAGEAWFGALMAICRPEVIHTQNCSSGPGRRLEICGLLLFQRRRPTICMSYANSAISYDVTMVVTLTMISPHRMFGEPSTVWLLCGRN